MANFNKKIYEKESNKQSFASDGYVLTGDELGIKQLSFDTESSYEISVAGNVVFDEIGGNKASVSSESFVHLSDDSIMALSDGVILDFNDLSENFINNYYVTKELPIYKSGDSYVISTSSGEINFGEHLWKLSDTKYLIRSSSLSIHFSEEDVKEVSNFVEIYKTPDGIINILTEENLWMTISDNCYIETAGGVKINPLTLLVDDGSYKITMSNLVVSADDSIVLSEDETRRQIVPELNIEAIDGEDGEDGENGQIGQDGVDGEIGQTGETGTDGESGSNGEQGVTGVDGEVGEDGEDGGQGAKGDRGKFGVDGLDATLSSSVNTAIPSMSLTRFETSSTCIKGQIEISDENGALEIDSSKYPGSITLTDEAGNVINLYETIPPSSDSDPLMAAESTDSTNINFSVGASIITFASQVNQLEPDTKYTLSISASYKVEDTVELIFRREFITRVVYTDSTGVIMESANVSQKGFKVNLSSGSDYVDSINTAEVYVLTKEQNEVFNKANIESSNYLEKVIVNYNAGGSITYENDKYKNVTGSPNLEDIDLDFEVVYDKATDSLVAISPNTDYVIRTRVFLDSGVEKITSQELNIKTLKTLATLDPTASENLSVSFNRTTGNFEVTRPLMNDPHYGIIAYKYNCYEYNSASNTYSLVQTRKLIPDDPYIAEFALEYGKQYKFEVIMEFDDNEKIVESVLAQSALVTADGDSLPGVTLTENYKDYSEFEGLININLGQYSSIDIGPNGDELILEIYAEGDLEAEFKLSDTSAQTDPVFGHVVKLLTDPGTAGSISASATQVQLDLQNLKGDTQYTIRIRGKIDLDTEKDEFVSVSTVGTVTFRTAEIPAISAVFSDDDTDDTARHIYCIVPDSAYEKVVGGASTITLYESNAFDSTTPIGYHKVSDLEHFFVRESEADATHTGYFVNQDSFGLNLDSSFQNTTTFTMKIEKVVDETTYIQGLDYENEFIDIYPKTDTITREVKPPDLTRNPDDAVIVTPIYKKDVSNYGGNLPNTYPNDLVVGYKLESTYVDSQRLALDVTYYGFEYSEFYRALESGNNPIDDAPKRFDITLKAEGKDELPSAIVLFDDVTVTFSDDTLYGIKDDSGNIIGHTNKVSGKNVYKFDGDEDVPYLCRGYKYIFAYEVSYNPTGASSTTDVIQTYPEGRTDQYNSYMKYYGCGQHMNKKVGLNVAYILNSGVVSAPKVAPTLQSFVYDTTYSAEAVGVFTVHYRYQNNIDETISLELGKTTQIEYEFNDMKTQIPIDDTSIGDGWYETSIPFVAQENGVMVSKPRVCASLYVINYDDIVSQLLMPTKANGEVDEESVVNQDRIYSEHEIEKYHDYIYLAKIPADYGYGFRYQNKNLGQMSVKVVPKESENMIVFELNVIGSNTATEIDLLNRAYAVEVKINNGEKTYYLPIKSPDGILSSTNYASISTSMLSDYLGAGPKKVEANILYDNGEQGFAKIDTSENPLGLFGLQRVSDSESVYLGDDEDATTVYNFDLLEYYLPSGYADGIPTGALATQDSASPITIDSFYDFDGEKIYAPFDFVTISSSTAQFYKYLRVTGLGIDFTTSENKDVYSNEMAVPKGVSSYKLKFDNNGTMEDSGYLEVNTIIPTISARNQEIGTNSVIIKGFKVSALEQIQSTLNGKPAVTMVVLETRPTGNILKSSLIKDDNSYTVSVDSVTGIADIDVETGVAIQNLEREKDYFLVFCSMVDGDLTILKDEGTSQNAIYEFQTQSTINLELKDNSGFYKYNYFEKGVEVSYSLNPIGNLIVTYEVYEDETEGKTVIEGDLVLENDDILPYLTKEALIKKDNNVAFNMKPGEVYSKVKPGGEYLLKISVREETAAEDEAEFVYAPFKVPAVGNVSAIVVANEIKSDSISFNVTIDDAFKTIMGINDTEPDSYRGGLYSVRFTYINDAGEEVRLFTKYDDGINDTTYPDIFKTNKIQQKFKLNQDALSEFKNYVDGQPFEFNPETEYTMYVMAAIDNDNNGKSAPRFANDTGGLWTDFFEIITDTLENACKAFINVIDSFWDINTGVSVTNKETYKDNFTVYTKTASTSNTDGILIGDIDDAVILSRNQNTQRFQFEFKESSGFIDVNGDQVFDKVTWSVTNQTNGSSYIGEVTEDMFEKSYDSAGNDIYTFDVPQSNLPYDTYIITMTIYYNDAEYCRVSKNIKQ